MRKLKITKTQESGMKKILKSSHRYSKFIYVKDGVLHATDAHRALSFKVNDLEDGVYKIDGLYIENEYKETMPEVDRCVYMKNITLVKRVAIMHAVTIFAKETGNSLNFKYVSQIGKPCDKCDIYFDETIPISPIRFKINDVLWTVMPCETVKYTLERGNVEKEIL